MAIKNTFFNKEVIGNVRTAQEDSHDIALNTQNGDIYVVCDGMGGHIGGKQASSIAVESILNYMINNRCTNPANFLNEALQQANNNILQYSMEHPELRGMGTTACILLFKDNEVHIAHVGDSRIYLYLGKEKQLHRITKDHSFVQTLVDAGEITDEEAESHPNKNRILKALGVHPVVKPTINDAPIQPKKGDIFLLCSDGLCGMINDGAIENVLSSEASLKDKGETLIELALKAGGHDNITVELSEILESPYKKTEFVSFNPKGRPNTPKKQSINKSKLLLILPAVFSFFILISIILGSLFIFQECEPYYIEKKIARLENKIKGDSIIKDSLSKKIKSYTENLDSLKNNKFKNSEDSEDIKQLNEYISQNQKNKESLENNLEKNKKELEELVKELETINKNKQKKEDNE